MKRILLNLSLILLLCTGVFAQTPTTLVVNGTLNLVNSSFSGTVALSGGVSGSGSIAIPSLTTGATGFSGNFTITLSGGNLTGSVTVPTSVLTGSGNITLSVTGGTGPYAGASGSFLLAGSGAFAGTSVTLTN